MGYMMDFYFESAAMILALITVGKMLEARSKGRTTDALKGLMKLAPNSRGGYTTQIYAGWHDWFCSDSALAGRLKQIGKVVIWN